jgi:dCMP deaminase
VVPGIISDQKQIRLKKRQDYISWDEYFMGVALLSAKRSKDPSTQVGACIVSDKNKIVGAGYNGLPMGCDDDEFPWEKTGEFLDTKYPYICHAELNAILNNIGMDLKGCKIYTALFPCNECSKAIIQSGITEVIYLSDKYEGTDIFKASKFMLGKAGIKYRKVESKIMQLVLSYNEGEV